MWWTPLAALANPSLDAPVPTGVSAAEDAAVVIGLEDYLFLPDVPYARHDAAAVADHLVSTRGVPPSQVTRLTSAGREQILAAVEAAGEAQGTVWVYFAGHGVAAPSDGRRLLLGDDTRTDPSAFEARGVHLEEVEALAGKGGGRVVLWVDACFHGAGRSGDSLTGGTRLAVPDYVAPASDTVLHWSAAEPGQLARPLHATEHGAFTYLSLGALRGWADGSIDGVRDGQVTADEAQVYVDRALRQVGSDDQQPALLGPGDWVLSQGATEAAPTLSHDPGEVPRPVPGPMVAAPSLGFDPELFGAAAAWDVELPLRRGLLGYRDAAGERVRRSTYWALVRSTDKGRKGLGLRTAGIVTTVAGYGLLAASGIAGFSIGEFQPGWATGAIVGGGTMIGGVTMIGVGDRSARAALEPRIR